MFCASVYQELVKICPYDIGHEFLSHYLFQFMSDGSHFVLESLLDKIEIPFNIFSQDKVSSQKFKNIEFCHKFCPKVAQAPRLLFIKMEVSNYVLAQNSVVY
jgi:hypothetical protein